MAKRGTGRGAKSEETWGRQPYFGLGPVNWAVFGVAVVCIVAGYLLLDRGSTTAAPMLLVLGYVVLLPTGLLVGRDGDGPGADRT